jgi:hypothetical protein
MTDITNENIEKRFIEDRIATEKDLKILKLEILNQMHNEVSSVKSYLLTRLGTMLVGGFSILGVLVGLK